VAGSASFCGYLSVAERHKGLRGIFMPDQTTLSATQARQGLAIYFPVLIVTSGIVEWLIVRGGDAMGNHPTLVFVLMWMPAFSSAVARLALREGIRDVSFRFGGKVGLRSIGFAVLMPLIVGTVAYGIAWATGLVGFSAITPSPAELAMSPAAARLAALEPTSRFLASVALGATIFTVYGCLWAAGEEIGWRGYMLTRLVAAGVPQPLFVSGLIWAVWHFPLILSGAYASGSFPLLSAALFTIMVIGSALVAGVLRLRSGSVWPAIVLHAAWNSIIQNPFDRSSVGPGATLWVGESGVFVAVTTLIVGLMAYWWWKKDGSKAVRQSGSNAEAGLRA
jgi:membrane protease YdiL (CAAX protease family)